MNWKLFLLFVGCILVLTQCRSRSSDEKAIEELSQAIRLDPNLAPAYYNWGTAYGNLGQNKRAIEEFDQVIRLNPNDAEAYYWRGVAYDALGQRERDIQDWRKACELGYQPACGKLEQED